MRRFGFFVMVAGLGVAGMAFAGIAGEELGVVGGIAASVLGAGAVVAGPDADLGLPSTGEDGGGAE
ncbi:hypothetical protein [Neoroseomonas oryzicola]|uniref:Uncharacterized protein n=1 Tax=Neoroseomonas oryzicola TaxID=535904 RepID=A0A9X9WER3_9PROT|nr:hypothetical protein [Neoroseomonas oryzicola]MBR0658823.1 hypothetical protein [Neoroseomonas oryzicola]NKE17301.1 hypothetical protein [Neoroseomonas oryzicola]